IGGVKMGGGDDTLTNNGHMTATGGSAIDMGTGNDVVKLVGGSTVTGSILLGDGNDVIHGARGGETIDGGAGNDYIDAGGGSAVVTGGTGADQFAFNGNTLLSSNVDEITDLNFADGDKIVLDHFAAGTFASLEGGNALLVRDGGGEVTIDSLTDI